MDSSMNKKAKLSLIINIVCTITSMVYLILAIVYFVAMIGTAATGNEYEMLGVVFGFFALPIILVILIIPVFRIITLIFSITLNKKVKSGSNATAFRVITGILQIVDAIASPIIPICIYPVIGLLFDSSSGLSFLFALSCIVFFVIVGAKSILQIVSAIMLFIKKKQA